MERPDPDGRSRRGNQHRHLPVATLTSKLPTLGAKHEIAIQPSADQLGDLTADVRASAISMARIERKGQKEHPAPIGHNHQRRSGKSSVPPGT